MSNKTYKRRFSTYKTTRQERHKSNTFIKKNNNFARASQHAFSRLKVMLHETIRNNDFYCNTALQ